MAPTQTTRGRSFDPAESTRQRLAERKALGRKLDQIERCYKQHTPPQLRSR
jgi:hypothetical protein